MRYKIVVCVYVWFGGIDGIFLKVNTITVSNCGE